MSFLPVGDYGVIGDLHTAALIGRNGSIDWLCAPRFDSPSVFAALLDDQRGGRWCIAPTVPATTEHRYLPGTNILVRSEEHTSELQSPCNLVCRLLLEKKKQKTTYRQRRSIP